MPYQSLIVERDVEVRMRDGVVLRADVYRPNTPTPLPVLLQRTPYGKGFSSPPYALMAAERGYAVVIQDTRGCWASDGDFYPLVHEDLDGYDTVEWAAHQPWADGQVGMFGASYVGYTQLAAAAARPPSLKTIIPMETFCRPYEIIYPGNVFALGVAVSWTLLSPAQMAILRMQPDTLERQQAIDSFIDAMDGMARGQTFDHVPLRTLPLVGEDGLTTFLVDVATHPSPHDDYWKRMTCALEALSLPIFHIGSWYDIFIDLTLADYATISAQGNRQQKVLIGPWTHANYSHLVGEVDFGLRASDMLVLPLEQQLRWFDHHLKGSNNGVMDEAPLRIFVMGRNVWRNEETWPPAAAQPVRYYLHSAGAANSLNGDGSLTPERPGDEPVDTFVYDPRNPVPTRGGGLCCWSAALPAGAYDQRSIEARPDVLVYTTPPLSQDLEVTGSVVLNLWVASAAADTDFTAKLVDVSPCGYARNIQDGIVHVGNDQAMIESTPYHPGEAIELTIEVGPTSNVFLAGHCVRVEISSSNYPRFRRNPNTGDTLYTATEMRPALQTVLHDTEHASHLVLPVIG